MMSRPLSPAIPECPARAPGQHGRDSPRFIKSLSLPRGGSRRFRPEDTLFLAPVPQWRSELEQVSLTPSPPGQTVPLFVAWSSQLRTTSPLLGSRGWRQEEREAKREPHKQAERPGPSQGQPG